MFVNILALGSPTHPVAPQPVGAMDGALPALLARQRRRRGASPSRRCSATSTATSSSTSAASATPSMREAGFDYFENSRRETYAQRAYCIANPMRWRRLFGPNLGAHRVRRPGGFASCHISARSGTFFGYSARGPIDEPDGRDDGTIAPTAALGSLPFAPEIVIPCADALRRWPGLFDRYGFKDSFNPSFTYTDAEHRNGLRRPPPAAGWRRIISASTRARSCSRPRITGTSSCGATCAARRRSGAAWPAPDSLAAGSPARTARSHRTGTFVAC